MPVSIAFFRGINAGGQNVLAMDDLLQQLERIGIRGARTHMESGNVAFRCTRQQQPEAARRIADAIQQSHGFRPVVLAMRIQELEHAVAANPFMDARKDPTSLHLWFLAAQPDIDLHALEQLKTPSERFMLEKKVLYLHAPRGIEESKLAAALENSLAVDYAVRNWQAVSKTLEMGWDLR